MDKMIEEVFLQNFIEKRIRDRIRFELNSEKRTDALWRFCHRTEEMIIKSNIYANNNILKKNEILLMLNSLGANKSCYVLSLNEEVDSKTIQLPQALNACYGYGLASIIICIPNQLVYIEGEHTQGPTPKYILYKKIAGSGLNKKRQ